MGIREKRLLELPPHLRTEHQEQVLLFRWRKECLATYPALRWLHAIPNGGYRRKREADQLKNAGVLKGALDLHLPLPRGPYYGWYGELKTQTGKPEPEQVAYVEYLLGAGYWANFLYGWEQARDDLLRYLEEKTA